MMNKFNNLPELFYFQADKNENNQHLLKLDSNNQVVSMSWLETKNLTKKIHNFLANKYFLTNFEFFFSRFETFLLKPLKDLLIFLQATIILEKSLKFKLAL